MTYQKIRYDVYISYTQQDRPHAQLIYDELSGAGLVVWFDNHAISYGSVIPQAIEQGLRDSRFVILCMSTAYFASQWCQLEYQAAIAIARGPDGRKNFIIPILLSDCEIPHIIGILRYFDFRDQDAYESQFPELLRACQSLEVTTNPVPSYVLDHVTSSQPHSTRHLNVSSDGKWLVSGSGNGVIWVWQIEEFELRCQLHGHGQAVTYVVFTPNDRNLLSLSADGRICIWDVDQVRELNVSRRDIHNLKSIAILDNDLQVVSGDDNGAVAQWSVKTNQQRFTSTKHLSEILCIDVSTDRTRAISGDRIGGITYWNLSTGDALETFYGHQDRITDVRFTSNGNHMISSSRDRIMKYWNLVEATCIRDFEGHQGTINALAISPDDKRLASAANDATLRIWDIDSGRCLQTISSEDRSGWDAVVFSSDGSRLFAGTRSSLTGIYVYRLTTGPTANSSPHNSVGPTT